MQKSDSQCILLTKPELMENEIYTCICSHQTLVNKQLNQIKRSKPVIHITNVKIIDASHRKCLATNNP